MSAEVVAADPPCAVCPAAGPTRARPGTAAKIAVMVARARYELPLFHPGDAAKLEWAQLEEELGGRTAILLRFANMDRRRQPPPPCEDPSTGRAGP